MPPAVEPELPPMSISRMDIAAALSVSRDWSRVAYPAVRRVTDWNRALSTRCPSGSAPRVAWLSHSTHRKKTHPSRISAAVMDRTSRVYRDSGFPSRQRSRSSHRKKPSPPATIITIRVRSTTGSPAKPATLA